MSTKITAEERMNDRAVEGVLRAAAHAVGIAERGVGLAITLYAHHTLLGYLTPAEMDDPAIFFEALGAQYPILLAETTPPPRRTTMSDPDKAVAEIQRGDGLSIPDAQRHTKPGEPYLVPAYLLLAAAAHMVNRAYCAALGDDSQPLWNEAPEWQRDSAIKGIAGALAGYTPEQSHEGWLEEKRRTGWKWGPVKNPEAKEHPCYVPYADLPPEQRRKDQMYLDTVRQLARLIGMPVAPQA